jgi:DNA transformation protein and related proteins
LASVDARGISDLFSPIGKVSLRRMFGGHGIYLQDRIFAIEAEGMIWLKVDAENRWLFEARGARPFTYARGEGTTLVMSYWSLPDAAYDDIDELRLLARSAFEAAGRRTSRATKGSSPQS